MRLHLEVRQNGMRFPGAILSRQIAHVNVPYSSLKTNVSAAYIKPLIMLAILGLKNKPNKSQCCCKTWDLYHNSYYGRNLRKFVNYDRNKF